MKAPLSGSVIATFVKSDTFLHALDQLQRSGTGRIRTFTPHPLNAVEERLDLRPSPIPKIVFGAFLLGALGGYGMQVYASVFSYPLNVGGRPLHSWPAFLPVTFELGVLTAALTGLVALFIRRRWPQLYVPELESRLIARGSHDRYVVAVTPLQSDRATLAEARDLLRTLGAEEMEVHDP